MRLFILFTLLSLALSTTRHRQSHRRKHKTRAFQGHENRVETENPIEKLEKNIDSLVKSQEELTKDLEQAEETVNLVPNYKSRHHHHSEAVEAEQTRPHPIHPHEHIHMRHPRSDMLHRPAETQQNPGKPTPVFESTAKLSPHIPHAESHSSQVYSKNNPRVEYNPGKLAPVFKSTAKLSPHIPHAESHSSQVYNKNNPRVEYSFSGHVSHDLDEPIKVIATKEQPHVYHEEANKHVAGDHIVITPNFVTKEELHNAVADIQNNFAKTLKEYLIKSQNPHEKHDAPVHAEDKINQAKLEHSVKNLESKLHSVLKTADHIISDHKSNDMTTYPKISDLHDQLTEMMPKNLPPPPNVDSIKHLLFDSPHHANGDTHVHIAEMRVAKKMSSDLDEMINDLTKKVESGRQHTIDLTANIKKLKKVMDQKAHTMEQKIKKTANLQTSVQEKLLKEVRDSTEGLKNLQNYISSSILSTDKVAKTVDILHDDQHKSDGSDEPAVKAPKKEETSTNNGPVKNEPKKVTPPETSNAAPTPAVPMDSEALTSSNGSLLEVRKAEGNELNSRFIENLEAEMEDEQLALEGTA